MLLHFKIFYFLGFAFRSNRTVSTPCIVNNRSASIAS